MDILHCPDWLFKKLSQDILPLSPTLPATSLRCYSSSYVVSRSIVAVVVNKLCSVFVVNAAASTNWWTRRKTTDLSMNLINQVFFVICSRSKLVTPKNTQLQPGFISKSVIQKNTHHQFSSTTQTKNLQQRNSDTEQATIRFRHQVMKSLGDRKMHNKRLRGHGNN